MEEHSPWKNVTRDLLILLISIVLTVVISDTDAFHSFLSSLLIIPRIGAFVSGFFFTSVFTIAPAALILANIAPALGLVETAIIGGIGAMISDTIIFFLFREKLMRDIDAVIAHKARTNPLSVFRFEFLKWLNPILGALVIISPLPDEIGLILLGFSNIKIRKLMILLFFLNVIGILLIGEIATVFQ